MHGNITDSIEKAILNTYEPSGKILLRAVELLKKQKIYTSTKTVKKYWETHGLYAKNSTKGGKREVAIREVNFTDEEEREIVASYRRCGENIKKTKKNLSRYVEGEIVAVLSKYGLLTTDDSLEKRVVQS